MRRPFTRRKALALMASLVPTAAVGASYPDRPIKLIVEDEIEEAEEVEAAAYKAVDDWFAQEVFYDRDGDWLRRQLFAQRQHRL